MLSPLLYYTFMLRKIGDNFGKIMIATLTNNNWRGGGVSSKHYNKEILFCRSVRITQILIFILESTDITHIEKFL